MNERDSEAVAAQLVAKGYSLAATEAAADVILLNTCSVRDMAEQKALRKMENLVAATRRRRVSAMIFSILRRAFCSARSRTLHVLSRMTSAPASVGASE